MESHNVQKKSTYSSPFPYTSTCLVTVFKKNGTQSRMELGRRTLCLRKNLVFQTPLCVSHRVVAEPSSNSVTLRLRGVIGTYYVET